MLSVEHPRFARNFEAISKTEQALLFGKRIAILGCGGLGGYVIEALCRAGVGSFVLCDGDVFETSNLNRQLLCTEQTLGHTKAEVAKARIVGINRDISVTAFSELMTPENAAHILAGCDLAVCALDTVSARKTLSAAAKAQRIPVVFGAIAGWCGTVATDAPDGDLLDTLYPTCEDRGEETALGNLACTAACAASLQAGECLKLLLGRPDTLKGRILQFDLLQNIFEIITL